MPDTFDSLRPRIIDYLYDRGIDPRKRFRCLNPSHLDRDPSMGFDPKRNKVQASPAARTTTSLTSSPSTTTFPLRQTPLHSPANGTGTVPQGVPSPSAPPSPPT